MRAARLLPLLAWVLRHDLTRNLREEVNAYTYRTPDTMLSSAQDWRPGYGGDQQHAWQATLGPDAVMLSSRKTPAGVEVIAAMDYDDQLLVAAGDAEGPSPGTPSSAEAAPIGKAPNVTPDPATYEEIARQVRRVLSGSVEEKRGSR